MKTELLKQINELGKSRFNIENAFWVNPLTFTLLLLETKGVISKDEIDDIQEYSDNKLKDMGLK